MVRMVGSLFGILASGMCLWASPSRGWFHYFAIGLLVFLVVKGGASWLRKWMMPWLIVPSFLIPNIAAVASVYACCLRYIQLHSSKVGITLAVLLLAGCSWSLGRLLLVTGLTTHTLRSLRKCFKEGLAPDLNPPHVLVIGTLGRGKKNQVLFNALKYLWNFTNIAKTNISRTELREIRTQRRLDAIPHDLSKVERFCRGFFIILRYAFGAAVWDRWMDRPLAGFIDQDDLEGQPSEFQEYVIAHASATLALNAGVEFQGGKGANKEEIQALVGVLPESLSTMIETSIDRHLALGEAQSLLMHGCTGPVQIIQIKRYLGERKVSASNGYEFVEVESRRASFELAAPIAQALASSALPVARAIAGLPDDLRTVPHALGSRGLAPLADAYLRFLISRSDVERFLSLFDCVEATVKYCVFAAAAELQSTDADLSSWVEGLKTPTMGIWQTTLHALLQENNSGKPLHQAVAAFWAERIDPTMRVFVDAVQGAGLNNAVQIPRSHLSWLEFMVSLRNATKGHGGLDEGLVGPLWAQLHTCVLHMFRELRPLTLDSTMVVRQDDGALRNLFGWQRGLARASSLPFGARHLEAAPACALLGTGSQLLDLFPFVRVSGDRCHTWNRMHGSRLDAVDMIDYATGAIGRWPLSPEEQARLRNPASSAPTSTA